MNQVDYDEIAKIIKHTEVFSKSLDCKEKIRLNEKEANVIELAY